MNFWFAFGAATVLLFIAIAIFSTKFLFPYHRIAALVVYGIGWIPFIYSLLLKRHLFFQQQDSVVSFLGAFWVHLIFGALMLSVLYGFLVLFPVAKSPFIGLTDAEIKIRLNEDEVLIGYLDTKISGLLNEVDEQQTLLVDFSNLSEQQKTNVRNFWLSYLETLIELDVLKERYKTFYQLNAVTKKDLHRQAFLNGYVSFVSQHYYALQLQERVGDNFGLITYFPRTQGSWGWW